MRKVIIWAVVVTALVFSGWHMWKAYQALKSDRDSYRRNTGSLMDEVKQYKTSDSLNAASKGVLELRLKEFEKFRADDAELIKTLQVKNRSLDNVVTTQTRTILKLKGTVRDSLVFVPGENTIDTLRCLKINDPWFSVDGCSNQAGEFTGMVISYDSLLIVATTKHKRFLGFLWKTRKVLDRKVDIVSKNPNSEISGIEFIEIRK